jgi:hypothetical protein
MGADLAALAIQVCADDAIAGADRRWPRMHAAEDTAERFERIGRVLGIGDQRMLAGEHATIAAVLDALDRAAADLAPHGLLAVMFSGHTVRGEGPIETARWCLFDGGLEMSQIADRLARLPGTARVLVVCDSCYAAAIASCLIGPQQVVLLASCGDDQTMIDRARSEFVVRLDAFVGERRSDGTLAQLRDVLADDTPDCERPVVWTNAPRCWSAEAFPVLSSPGDRRGEALDAPGLAVV